MSQIQGVVATVKSGYFTVATIRGYLITRDRETKQWTAEGTLVTVNSYRIRTPGLVLVVPLLKTVWQFPILDPLPQVPGPFMARIGPRLE